MIRRIPFMALLTGLAVLAGLDARAQVPAGTGANKIYTRRTAFKLPVRIDDRERSRLREVQLYVRNGPGEAWTCKETAPPSQTEFTFRVPQDGEYWFSVVTVDQDGRQTPADVNVEVPGLIVLVDTTPPDCDVRTLKTASGDVLIYCDLRDVNPDPEKMKLEYLAPDQTWRVLEPHPHMPKYYRPADPSVFRGVLRATVHDLAGNVTTRDFTLPEFGGGSAPAVAERAVAPVPQTPAPAAPAVQTVVEKPAAPAPAAPVTPSGAPLQVVNNKHVSLDYQVDQAGPSGVGKVEVWLTRDEGKTWQRQCEDPDHASPVEVDLPGEGTFGVTLVVYNGNGGGGAPPAGGAPPDWWVEVDCTRPVGQLMAVRPSKDEPGCFLVTWTASDKNLKADPVDLYYAVHREGPWLPVSKNLKNDGNYRWVVPPGVSGEVFVRLELTDRAGNVTRCETATGAVVDLARPRAKVLGITAGGPQAAAAN